jgi:hypothetical protein
LYATSIVPFGSVVVVITGVTPFIVTDNALVSFPTLLVA